jgi:hypothetical protein
VTAKTMHEQAKNNLQDKISNAKLEFNLLIRIIQFIAKNGITKYRQTFS